MKVNETDPRVTAMALDWALIDDLLGGTRAMRLAGERYLPKWTLEEVTDYQSRLKIATLLPALAETVRKSTGRVFAKQLELGEDVPPWIADEVWPDVDRQGINGHAWARGWFYRALAYGLDHVLVDAPPKVLPTGEEIRTQADQRAAGVRPYLINISRDRILGWQTGEDGNLTQVRITWSKTIPGDFAPTVVPQIRVYEIKLVRVYEERETAKGKEWVEVEQIEYDLPVIPLVTLYTGRTGMMQAEPPLRELAFLNAKHWAQQCSTDSLLQTASVPILCATGMDEETSIKVGSKNAIKISNPNAKLAFVEHSGKAIGSGRESLKDLEGQMRAIGAKLLEPTEGTKTATQAGEEADAANSPLASMVQDLEDALEQLLYVIGLYRGEPEGGNIEVRANLDPDAAPIESMNVIGKMVATGGLSAATQFAEAQRRGILSPELDWEDEQARIGTQGTGEPL